VIFSWTTGPEGGPAVVSGREVLIIRDGTKVSRFYVLIDAWHSD